MRRERAATSGPARGRAPERDLHQEAAGFVRLKTYERAESAV